MVVKDGTMVPEPESVSCVFPPPHCFSACEAPWFMAWMVPESLVVVRSWKIVPPLFQNPGSAPVVTHIFIEEKGYSGLGLCS